MAQTVATVTFANGGDNIGVYLPVFATADTADVLTYCVVFLVMVGAWCALGAFLATRRPVARALSRWGHVLLPAALVAVGLAILAEGGACGLDPARARGRTTTAATARPDGCPVRSGPRRSGISTTASHRGDLGTARACDICSRSATAPRRPRHWPP